MMIGSSGYKDTIYLQESQSISEDIDNHLLLSAYNMFTLSDLAIWKNNIYLSNQKKIESVMGSYL